MQRAQYVLLDFDGPICDVFSGFPAPEVAAILRKMLKDAGVDLPPDIQEQDDPMEVFRFSAQLGSNLNHATLKTLTALEVEAAATAEPTPGAIELIQRSHATGKAIAVVSNNSEAAVTAFIHTHGLLPTIDLISARVEPDPSLMKPNPHLVRQAIAQLGADVSRSLLIGDSVTDMQASKATGITAVGYANKPGKAKLLEAAGADLLVASIEELL
ncbi:HAD family hydrolase [Planotetraspora phitsanulokensis]|uniref:Hydrolase n=2 Tax=Planotetraspora phitsanulokensis TaxID=575192 RepID=A0A8J3U7X3_9ACTN|nr:HAD family hydrolase [Planotetraspora phitsanulokensis]GII40329.1 hydrolase [Planotetraspora phitsanulokensis]